MIEPLVLAAAKDCLVTDSTEHGYAVVETHTDLILSNLFIVPRPVGEHALEIIDNLVETAVLKLRQPHHHANEVVDILPNRLLFLESLLHVGHAASIQTVNGLPYSGQFD